MPGLGGSLYSLTPPHPCPILCRYIPSTSTRGQPLSKLAGIMVALPWAVGGGRWPRVCTRYAWHRRAALPCWEWATAGKGLKPILPLQPTLSILMKHVYPWAPGQGGGQPGQNHAGPHPESLLPELHRGHCSNSLRAGRHKEKLLQTS